MLEASCLTSDASRAGAIATSYEAFGAGAKSGQPGYNGQEATAGLVYMRNRWYDPNTGRFTQEDPIGIRQTGAPRTCA